LLKYTFNTTNCEYIKNKKKMVQAAKLIGAGSALIALAGVGAGIGIVFGSLIQS